MWNVCRYRVCGHTYTVSGVIIFHPLGPQDKINPKCLEASPSILARVCATLLTFKSQFDMFLTYDYCKDQWSYGQWQLARPVLSTSP